jgi:hypothetical protein
MESVPEISPICNLPPCIFEALWERDVCVIDPDEEATVPEVLCLELVYHHAIRRKPRELAAVKAVEVNDHARAF